MNEAASEDVEKKEAEASADSEKKEVASEEPETNEPESTTKEEEPGSSKPEPDSAEPVRVIIYLPLLKSLL